MKESKHYSGGKRIVTRRDERDESIAVTLESIASVPRECDPFCYLEGLKVEVGVRVR